MRPCAHRPDLRRAKAGSTLLESMIALSLFTLLIGACMTTIHGGRDESERGGRAADLVRRADRVLSTITAELGRSGFTSAGGVDYPFLSTALRSTTRRRRTSTHRPTTRKAPR